MEQTVFILLVVIILLTGGLVYLYLSFQRLKDQHQHHVSQLEQAIVSLTAESGQQLDQLKLSDELMQRLNQARVGLDKALIGLTEDYARAVSKS